MKHYFRLFCVFLIGGIVCFSTQSTATGQSTDEILNRLKATYREDTAIRAEFSQKLTAPDGQPLPLVTGTVVVLGNRYRVETDDQTFVSDGETTWIYNAYDNQVIVNDFVDDPATFSLSTFLFAFDENYEITDAKVEDVDGVPHLVLMLRPRADDSFFREVTLWMRDKDSVITRLRVVDVNEAMLDFSLTHMEFDPTLEGNPFSFVPPESAEIIDLRS